jgi:type VI protein secretion system component Hcp
MNINKNIFHGKSLKELQIRFKKKKKVGEIQPFLIYLKNYYTVSGSVGKSGVFDSTGKSVQVSFP